MLKAKFGVDPLGIISTFHLKFKQLQANKCMSTHTEHTLDSENWRELIHLKPFQF